ncbi:MAG: hypothetical protein JHC87_05945 [Thermoleophilaceae bacterium]|nr:hypothetical protein [Thermoleophilaceae bacterium]
MSANRRRVVLAVSVACGMLAAIGAQQRLAATADVRGVSVAVLVTTTALQHGVPLDAPTLARSVELRRVPAPLSPGGSIGARDELLGLTPAVEVPRGTMLTSAFFRSSPVDGVLKRGERAVNVVASANDGSVEVGARVDVFASNTERGGSAALLVEGAEVLEPATDGDGAASSDQTDAPQGATPVRLRVSLRQAALLLAASNESTRLTLLLRPQADKTAVGAVSVTIDRILGE